MGLGLKGSVMSIIWTASSLDTATRAYVEEPIVVVVMPRAPPSPPSSLPPTMDATGAGLEGSVMSIIWMPPVLDATMAYAEDPTVNVAMPYEPRRATAEAALMCAVGAGLEGVVMSIIWTPAAAVTSAYVEEPTVAVVMPRAPRSSSNPSTPSVTAATGLGLKGSVMSTIWTPSSSYAATRAYVEEPIVTVVMPFGPPSSSNPSTPSATNATGDMTMEGVARA